MDACRRFAPDVVGLQCNFTTERYRTVRLAERVRREMPDAFVRGRRPRRLARAATGSSIRRSTSSRSATARR